MAYGQNAPSCDPVTNIIFDVIKQSESELANTRQVYLKPGGSGRDQQPSVKMHVTA